MRRGAGRQIRGKKFLQCQIVGKGGELAFITKSDGIIASRDMII